MSSPAVHVKLGGSKNSLQKAGSRNGRNQRGKHGGDHLEHRIGDALLPLVLRLAAHIHQLHHFVVDLFHLISNHHLELTASVHHGDHPFQTADLVFVRQLPVL